ncbi:uncharacterized protein ACA1_308240 [Acanthamoeba castellanii str. Neff]|uniref:Uncharacterized protein n=1 Tax=Acanthamoeba castellanii (strain ATCC 30010 / Neff) TaxID=1257118 RepID=L8HJD8_ACACF|nr:uncharacterized protein ACA1_308240 [Acanthamoeba castellanii str. Neff]ELR25704.1 hypothetical protein ACA1_308240 [Acanthamoeba castellanii str. Neff]
MLGLSIGVEDVCDDAFEPKCSLFNQLTLVDRQEDFGAVHFEDAVVRLAKWGDGQLRANARAKGWVDAVNFRDLTQRHLIEPFRLDVDLRKPSSYQSKHWPDQDTALRATIQTSPVELNVTQASATERHQQGPVGMYSAYVLINDTQCDLCYGQYHTEEELILPALSRSSYYWRTHRVKLVQQRLKFWSAVDKGAQFRSTVDFVAAHMLALAPLASAALDLDPLTHPQLSFAMNDQRQRKHHDDSDDDAAAWSTPPYSLDMSLVDEIREWEGALYAKGDAAVGNDDSDSPEELERLLTVVREKKIVREAVTSQYLSHESELAAMKNRESRKGKEKLADDDDHGGGKKAIAVPLRVIASLDNDPGNRIRSSPTILLSISFAFTLANETSQPIYFRRQPTAVELAPSAEEQPQHVCIRPQRRVGFDFYAATKDQGKRTSQSGGAEDEESLVSPAPVLLTYSVVTRDGATTVVAWRDQFPPFKLVNACPFPIYYAQYHDDRRRMERTKCAVPAGQMVEYDWMWKESTTLPRRTDPSEARPDGSDKGNDNEEEQQEDAEEEQEQLEKQNEKETPKTRAEDLLEPKAWSLNRLCVRTGESAWSREFPIDHPHLGRDRAPVDVRVVPCGPTFVVYFDDPSTKPTAAIERNADHHATTASDRHPTATAVKSGGFKVDFAVPLLSLSFLAPPELHAEDWNTGSPAAVPASTTYHTLIETVNTSLDDVRLSFVSTEGPSADSPLQQCPLETTKRQSVSLSISSFQVDNHMPFYDFPVVALSNASSSSSHASVSSSSPAVACTLERAFFPLLGNPRVATGIYDFFALPATGAKEAGVLGFMSGLGRGLSSLVMHVSEGTLTSVSDLSSSLMRNVDNLSLDSDYVRYNKMRLRNAPEQVHTGFARGLQGFGEGVIDGAMGLVAHPIAGLSDGGLTGAVKGLGIGVMGAISKPLSGAVGLLAQTSQRWARRGSVGIGCTSATRCPRRSSQPRTPG